MAAGWMQHLAADAVEVFSGGSDPASQVNGAAVAAMAEVGIDISTEFPKPWTDEIVRAADVIVTMGCGDACPLYRQALRGLGLADPDGQDLAAVRRCDDIAPCRNAHRSSGTFLDDAASIAVLCRRRSPDLAGHLGWRRVAGGRLQMLRCSNSARGAGSSVTTSAGGVRVIFGGASCVRCASIVCASASAAARPSLDVLQDACGERRGEEIRWTGELVALNRRRVESDLAALDLRDRCAVALGGAVTL
jgi:hypothetical protein